MKRMNDWKDVAESYYEKAFSLTLLLVLFTFIVYNKITFKAYEQFKMSITNTVYIPDEVKTTIPEPKITVLPRMNVIIDDETFSGIDDELNIATTITGTNIDYNEIIEVLPEIEKIDDFVIYDESPVAVKTVNPVYPKFERNAGIEGKVVLDIRVLANGRVGDVSVYQSSGFDSFDNAAIQAVKSFIFQPAKTNGKAVAVWLKIPFEFSLEK